MIVAALDIGSNSIRLLIAESTPDGLEIIRSFKEKVKLGAGLDTQNQLTEQAIDRGRESLGRLLKHLNIHHVEKLFCVATNAIRLANNRRDFIQMAEQTLMHPVHVISGDTEAELIWKGIVAERTTAGTGLVVDIGGGSTEFAVAVESANKPLTLSLQMGCVSYSLAHIPDGKLTERNFDNAITAAKAMLAPHVEQLIPLPKASTIGAAGTLESISLLGREMYPHANGVIEIHQLDDMIKRLIQHGDAAKLPYHSLDENRKQILPAGICICKAIMEELSIEEIIIAKAELCEGVLVENLGVGINSLIPRYPAS